MIGPVIPFAFALSVEMTTTNCLNVLQRSRSKAGISSSSKHQQASRVMPLARASTFSSTLQEGENAKPIHAPKATTNAPCVAAQVTVCRSAQCWPPPSNEIL
jgi:hypothetical protein